MKLSGHNYNNDVFSSLLDGLGGDVVLNKQTSRSEQSPITGMDLFSATTADTLALVKGEEFQTIAAELNFAADRAKIALIQEDFVKFAKDMHNQNITRGKKLERAAQRYCNDMSRAVAPPSGTIRTQSSSAHGIGSATYDSGDDGINDGKTGGFLGMSKNPNTIWDSGKLAHLAQQKGGDEMIKESKAARTDYVEEQKNIEWQQKQSQASDPGQVGSGSITKSANIVQNDFNPSNPENSMSVFSEKRDFENIPELTVGESVVKLAEERAKKAKEAKEEWDKSEPAKKIADNLDVFFKEGK